MGLTTSRLPEFIYWATVLFNFIGATVNIWLMRRNYTAAHVGRLISGKTTGSNKYVGHFLE